MISYGEAQKLVLAQARSFGKETVSLDEVSGRVLSGVIRADRDYPPFDRSTMDGYALRFSELQNGVRRFVVIETILAGCSATQTIGSGECYKIMTGAAVPPPADIVIQREDVGEGTGFVQVLSDSWPSQNIARQGEDLASGTVVIDRSCVAEPAIVGLLATLGETRLAVERIPKIALLTTGSEIVSPGEPVGPVQIRNSNRWLLEAALRQDKAGLSTVAHAPDDPAILAAEIARGLEHDVFLLSGGVSAGDADYVPQTLLAAGVRQLFHRVAIRPGKPVWVGVASNGCMVFALPGNPFSCLVNMVLLIRPYLRACYGLAVREPLGLPLSTARKKRSPLDEFFPAILQGSPAALSPVALNTSGDIRLGMGANMLALHPAASGDLAAGESVLCYPI